MQLDFHEQNATPELPLNQIPFTAMNPGSAALAKIMGRYRQLSLKSLSAVSLDVNEMRRRP